MMDIVARAMASKALSQSGSSQYKNKSEFPSIGKEGQLYIDIDTNMIYYWENSSLTYKCLNISEGTEEVAKEAVVEVLQQAVFNGGSASTEM